VKRLLEKSTKISVDGSRPLLLADSGKVWIVQEGRLDVFAARMEKGEPTGHRSHVLTAGPGQPVWGISPERHGTSICLLATGLYGTSVSEVPVSEIAELAGDEEGAGSVARVVDSWARSAIGAIAGPVLPKDYVELEETDELVFDTEAFALCRKDVLWVRRRSGRLTFSGRDDTGFELDAGFFPITERGCILAAPGSAVEVRSTASLLTSEDAFGRIEEWGGRLMDILEAHEDNLVRRESLRMGERAEQDRGILRSAMRDLAEVMGIGRKDEAAAYEAGNPLLAACRMVGKRSRIDIEAPGSKEYDLEGIARASRMRTRRVILKEEWWRSDCGPFLAFLEDGDRPVALLPVSKSRYEIWYPETGERAAVTGPVAETVKPFAHTFYRTLPSRVIVALDLVKFGYQSAWASDFWVLLTVGVLGGILGLITPVATGFIFDKIIPQAERGQLTQLGMFLFVSALASFLFQVARAIATLRAESHMNVSLQAAVWDRVLSLPLPFFRKYNAGDLATRVGGINAMRQVLSSSVINSVFSGVFSVFSLLLLFYYSSFLAWRAALLSLLSVVVTLLLGWFTLRYQKEIVEIGGKLNGLVLQIIGAIAKFRVSGAERRAFRLWSSDFGRRRRLQFKSESVSNTLAVWNSIFPVMASMLIFYLVVKSRKIDLSIGNFLAFNTAFTNFTAALLGISTTILSVLSIVPLYRRTRPILETLPEYDDTKGDPGELRGNIEVSHVMFRYDADGPVILDDVQVGVNQGDFAALVGPSGSGKSTLLRLLLGFERVGSGAVYYDGQDLSTLDLRLVRSQIGVVLQNGSVLAGDIFNNIIGASANLTVEDAWEAAEMSGLAEDIRQMPMGMYTYIAEGGTTLSGGQKQRLLIARAIVSRPRIIFFDEATSALDNRTQEIVSRSLESLNATRIVIAHRLSTVINADRIIVLERGKIVQQGSYRELMRQEEGTFAKLARRQLA